MRKCLLVIIAALFCTGQTCTPPATTDTDNGGTEELIYTNTNTSGVSNNPTAATTFTLSRTCQITHIRTYHWNSAQGTSVPGTISLQSSGGTSYGPWVANGESGQGGVPNAYWDCYPNIELAAGTYTVVDSDNATWSQNSQSGYAGIVWVYGICSGGSSDIDLVAIAKQHTHVSFNFWGLHNYASDEDGITVMNDYASSGIWASDVSAPITWNGNTFTVNHQNSTTTSTGTVWTKNIQMTGTLSADGRSISNWSGLSVTTSNSSLLGENTTRSYLVGSGMPIPYREDPHPDGDTTFRLVYEIEGAGVQNYLQTVEYNQDILLETYTSTDYNNTTYPPDLFIMFSSD